MVPESMLADAAKREKVVGIAASSYEEIPCLRDSGLTETLRKHGVVGLNFLSCDALLSNLSCPALS